MQLSSIILYVLTAASAVAAAPAPSRADVVRSPPSRTEVIRSPPTKRPKVIANFPPYDWECKTSQTKPTTKLFSSDYLERSVVYALELRDNGDNKAGNSKYPEYITAPETIPGLEDHKGETNIDHFPLNYDDKTVFSGGTPTSDARVFYKHSPGDDLATFLGVWTHAGRKDGKFEKCTEKKP